MNQTLSQEQEKELARHHRDQIRRVGIYFGVPSYFEKADEGFKSPFLIGHLGHWGRGIDYNPLGRNFPLVNHVSRVTLDSVVLADMLDFGKESSYFYQGFLFIQAAMGHDAKKNSPDLIKLALKKEGFTEQDREKMKDHVRFGSFGLDEAFPISADHHRWQRRGYSPIHPVWNTIRKALGMYHIKRTPESETLSKFLGIIDFHDSAATRANTRNYKEPRLPTTDELKDLLEKEYGELPLKYKGRQLPKIDMSGAEVIDLLFTEGVFGRENVFNPYQEPFSFIKRQTPEETLNARNVAQTREAEIEMKDEDYCRKRRVKEGEIDFSKVIDH